jgi:hypothetical protein
MHLSADMSLGRTFYIQVFESGHHVLALKMHDAEYEMLAEFAPAESTAVEEVLRKIYLAVSRREEYNWSPSEQSSITVKRKVSTIRSSFDQFPPTLIATEDLIDVLRAWQQFLIKYEQGLIPGITKVKSDVVDQ